ncbi:MAG: nitrophenyl compound nitroreductase subunit ArsF family protein [Firmicutes bacterium]|nr:nitrophenyl compound nitroreductase subunit ArsF family protein [Bacillota bacterium]
MKKHTLANIISLAVIVLISMLFAGCGGNGNAEVKKPVETADSAKTPAKETASASSAEKSGSANGYVVYYFHGNVRCPSCQKIESYTQDTLKNDFTQQLTKGNIQWKVVNTDENENKHFVKDYQLYTKSVVVVEMKDGKPGRWKNLDKVWEYLGDKSQFSNYISNEVRQFMDGVNG